MKKIICLLCCMFCVGAAYPAAMCVKDNTTTVFFPETVRNVAPIAQGSNNTANKTWYMTYSWGTISGIGGCYDGPETTANTVATAETQAAVTTQTTGSKSYAKVLSPFETDWIYLGTHKDAATCARLATGGGTYGGVLFEMRYRYLFPVMVQNAWGKITAQMQ